MVMATMRAAGLWPPTLSQIVRYMDPEQLDILASKVGGETAERVCAYVDSLSERAKADLGGGRNRLAVLCEGELGRWLDPELGEGPQLSLDLSLRAGEVVYYQPRRRPLPGPVKALRGGAGDRPGHPDRRSAGPPAGRPGGDRRVRSTRRRAGQPALRPRPLGRAQRRARRPEPRRPARRESRRCLRHADRAGALKRRVHPRPPDRRPRLRRAPGTGGRDNAGLVYDPAGSGGGGWIGTPSEGTRTREREFVVLPDQFKRLGIGEAVLITPTAKRLAQVVRVWLPGDGRSDQHSG